MSRKYCHPNSLPTIDNLKIALKSELVGLGALVSEFHSPEPINLEELHGFATYSVLLDRDSRETEIVYVTEGEFILLNVQPQSKHQWKRNGKELDGEKLDTLGLW